MFISNTVGFSGGAIHNEGGNFILGNCTFKGNAAESYGGAIRNTGDGFNVSNFSFINNKAYYDGSAIGTDKSCVANDNWWGTNSLDWDDLVYGRLLMILMLF